MGTSAALASRAQGLVLDTDTRWGYTLSMLRRFLELFDIMEKDKYLFVLLDEVGFGNADLASIKATVERLTPFEAWTQCLCAVSSPSICLVPSHGA